MPEPNGAAKDQEPDGVPPERLTASRLAGLFGAGLAGGIVGSIVGGAVVAPVVTIFGPGKNADLDAGVLAAIGRGVTGGALGALLGYPMGVARGLRSAGALLRLRGRYWPTVGGAYIGLLLVLLLGPGVCWLTAMRWLPLAWVLAMLLSPLVSLIGGLVGFISADSGVPVTSDSSLA